jgi:hypothetical protein
VNVRSPVVLVQVKLSRPFGEAMFFSGGRERVQVAPLLGDGLIKSALDIAGQHGLKVLTLRRLRSTSIAHAKSRRTSPTGAPAQATRAW